MGSTRRYFTEEYKASAVALVLEDGRGIAETARNIGVHEMTLGKWVRKVREAGGGKDRPLSESERAALDELRKENARLRMEVDFAKKWRPGSRRKGSEVCCDRGLG